MTVYTIRPEFTIHQQGIIYLGGEDIDLNAAEFELHKHKLEGVESSQVPEGQGNTVGGSVGNGECCFPAPYVTEIRPNKFKVNFSVDIEIKGSFLTPDITISIEGLTIQKVEFVDSHLITLSVLSGDVPGLFEVSLDNGNQTIADTEIEIVEDSSLIVDLRSGGTEFTDSAIQRRSGMSFARNADGLSFNGADPWTSWARFVGDENIWTWQRNGGKKKLSWIFKDLSSFMVGIGSTQSDPNSTAQYSQAEITGYFQTATIFYGFYGNSGTPGNNVSFRASGSAVGGLTKLILEDNGEVGSNFYLYGLPSESINDWQDTSNLLSSGVVANNMTADAPTIMPFCIPRSTGTITKFLGFIIEDM